MARAVCALAGGTAIVAATAVEGIAFSSTAEASEIPKDWNYEHGTQKIWADTVSKKKEHAGVYIEFEYGGKKQSAWLKLEVWHRDERSIGFNGYDSMKELIPKEATVTKKIVVHSHPVYTNFRTIEGTPRVLDLPPSVVDIYAEAAPDELAFLHTKKSHLEAIISYGREYQHRLVYLSEFDALRREFTGNKYFHKDLLRLRWEVLTGLTPKIQQQYESLKGRAVGLFEIARDELKWSSGESDFFESRQGKIAWQNYCAACASFGRRVTTLVRPDLNALPEWDKK
jgi:hypothetical protein